MYKKPMRYEWNSAKNELLKRERNISFEKILFHLSEGDLWKIADHPNQKDYPGKKIYFVIIDGYIHMVPFIIDDEYIFLKTIIPSRKATKNYNQENGD